MGEKFNIGYYAVIPADVRYDSELSPNSKLLYGEITALSNKNGYCWANNSYFSDLYGVDSRTIQRWIKSLIDNGYVARESDGKRYLKITTPHDKNVTPPMTKMSPPHDKNVTHNNTYNNTYEYKENNIKEVAKREFDELWDMYPRKQGKTRALNAYVKARGKGVTFDEVKNGIQAYIEYCKANKTEKRYIKQGGTWFYQECWNDDYTVETKCSNGALELLKSGVLDND